ncbi:methionine gamma-lyase family protein [Alicyclobacillus vulcanalis]|uniref:Cystathionine beta-lyase family protein involved in aluminum resistance n=1 Tax=Alicyclobacillus vulcanalis TaxID=252246 RepID=A0A1N7NI24_9BACL|nr:methionine gamma-lyase family protein [Alicyclobacillus vulcanalis]SIS97972.1 Cystathionine beta-lyase family protein involved in aluminum resistance [Alicyclobacillus vulcanalis]
MGTQPNGDRLRAFVASCEAEIEPYQRTSEAVALANQERVLEAFWRQRVSQFDLGGSTGYGLGDTGREKLEAIYADVFGAEAALVRPQIVSGTHAIALVLFGCLRPGDRLVVATGVPYDTLHASLGLQPAAGSLVEHGIAVDIVPLGEDGRMDLDAIERAVGQPGVRLALFQRSRGYASRPSFSIDELEAAFAVVKRARPDVWIAVDNCYGEFVEEREPCHVGADVAMGSLIKNPGAGICVTGGYVVGRQEIVERVAARLVAPGTAAEYGPTGAHLLPMFQALFLAPHAVLQAVKGSRLFAAALQRLGFRVSPAPDAARTDLILSVELGTPDRLLAFCRAIQAVAPIDGHVRPEPAPMAGYADPVVMAAGTFVQGASLELTADAPMRPPYVAYVQGGLTYEHAVLAVRRVAAALCPDVASATDASKNIT